MAGQSAMETRETVRAAIKSAECNKGASSSAPKKMEMDKGKK